MFHQDFFYLRSLIIIFIIERFFKFWYNSSSSLIVDMFRPSGTHPTFYTNYASRVLNQNNFIQIYITRHFHCQNHGKNVYFFLHPVEHNSRPLRSVDRCTNYASYRWKMYATFGDCFKFFYIFQFLRHAVHKSQVLGNWKNVKHFTRLNMPHDRFNRSLW